MKSIKLTIVMMALAVPSVCVGVPKTPEYKDYDELLNDSPFGKKKPPVVEVAAPVVEEKTTLGLLGVSKLADGWVVTFVDSKKPGERFMVESSQGSVNGVSISSVDQDIQNYRNTTVVVTEGGRNYKVTFDAPAIDKSIASSVKSQQNANTSKGKTKRSNIDNSEYQKMRSEMMKESEELRKMRDAGNTGAEYQKRRKELMEKSAEMRSQWRQRRRGGSSRQDGRR